jgi:hypothetical protein
MPYNSVKLQNNLKRKFILERLLEKGIMKSQQGEEIHTLGYEELKYELVLAAFREIDAENDNNKWF